MTEHNTGPDGHGPLEPTDGNLDRRAACCARTPLHRHARALDACLRDPPVARRRRLGRDHRRPVLPRRDDRRQPEGRVRDPWLGHAEGDRPDRVRVRGRAGRRAQPRLRRAGGRDARHARAAGGDRGRDRQAPDRRVRADRGQGRDRERRRPVRRRHDLRRRAHRLHRGPVRPRSSTTRTARRSSPSRTPSATRSSRPASPPSSTATPSSRRSSRERRSCSAFSRR